MKTIDLIIDGKTASVPEGTTLLEAAAAVQIDIPRLCYDPRVEPLASCRLCVVKLAGRPGMVTSCNTAAAAGMRVTTEDEEIAAVRKGILELILSEHRVSCTSCDQEGDCRLQDYAYRYGADEARFGRPPPYVPRPNYATTNKGLSYDPTKCIRCGLCVKFCADVQMAEALTFTRRGETMEVTTAFDIPLHESTCELCGGCVRVCPTGAIREKAARGLGRARDLIKVPTTCTYCGVGCTLELNVNPGLNRIVRVTTQPGMGSNDGNLCVKGHFAFDFTHSPERLKTPLIKENGAFREASWDEAIALVGRRLRELRDLHGPEGIAFQSSCRCTNEENYLMQKLARIPGGTNNIDQCATTCHAPTVAGLAAAFGSGAMTNSIEEIKNVQTLFLIGANPTEAHPIVGLEMKKAMRRGARLIVCDPRETWMARHAHIHIKHRPGTDNMLVNAMMHHILDRGLQNRAFVEERLENFEAFRANVLSVDIEQAAAVCGVEADLIRRAAEAYATGTPSSIFYTLGITEHTCGTENVQNLANLAMLCGQIGKESSGVNPLRGQNNVQGACDMGALPNLYPGYQPVTDPQIAARFAQAWALSSPLELPAHPGLTATEMVDAFGTGAIRALYILGEDPALTDPELNHTRHSLARGELLILQEIFPTATAEFADVLLPGVSFAEKAGTFTNT
ncbi:MAG: molybdopterin-dependent oxidoreductase, partial [Lentisphaerae bacterium]|nr:molybdopterin-dependent oxidoreductase [Lentisphaerota bacterium]